MREKYRNDIINVLVFDWQNGAGLVAVHGYKVIDETWLNVNYNVRCKFSSSFSIIDATTHLKSRIIQNLAQWCNLFN